VETCSISSIYPYIQKTSIYLLFKYFIPALKNYREALFAGWFGPIGVAAVFYATLAISYIHLDDEENERVRNIVFPIVLFLVFSSILIHGLTVPAIILYRKMMGLKGALLLSEDTSNANEMKNFSKQVDLRDEYLEEGKAMGWDNSIQSVESAL